MTLELTPITKKKKTFKEFFISIMKDGWVFEGITEKIIISASISWATYSIIKFILGI